MNLLNVYGPGISILFVVFVEAAGVCWFYGVDRFSLDIEEMIGHRPGIFWRVCWNYISPVFLLVSDRCRGRLTPTTCTVLKTSKRRLEAGILIRARAGRPGNWGSIPSRNKSCFSLPDSQACSLHCTPLNFHRGYSEV